MIFINVVVPTHFDRERRMTNMEVSKQAFALAVDVRQEADSSPGYFRYRCGVGYAVA
ncbi:hypothetical protein [Burkholderia anthina]|uniref:hypothetical protein n=1 Tax=Burkholderia anthina TaxID=179879 RepID=UPI00158C2B40|nr:hypothetical protein [Burkholderia anthina]